MHMVYATFISTYFDLFTGEENFPMNLIMLFAGDIETNPGPVPIEFPKIS